MRVLRIKNGDTWIVDDNDIDDIVSSLDEMIDTFIGNDAKELYRELMDEAEFCYDCQFNPSNIKQ